MLMFPPLDAAVGTAAAVVSTFAAIAAPLAGANATALAIVGFTLVVRLAISPLSYLQVRAERGRAALAPRLRELHRRHRDDRARLQAELMALYRAERVNPFGGCLPALLQAPFFLVMYRLATDPPAGGDLLAETLFGVPLGHRLADGLAGAAAPVFACLLVLLAVLAWWLSRRLRRRMSAGGPDAPAPLARLLPLLPYGTLAVAAFTPLAAGLYLLTTTAWTALEHATLRRGPE
jgi:YidC/Oxa1 family membrane protein insertase